MQTAQNEWEKTQPPRSAEYPVLRQRHRASEGGAIISQIPLANFSGSESCELFFSSHGEEVYRGKHKFHTVSPRVCCCHVLCM